MQPFIVKARPALLGRHVHQTFICRFINTFYNHHMNDDLETAKQQRTWLFA
jgi:hypothetical protein